MTFKIVQAVKYPLTLLDKRCYQDIGAERVVIECNTDDDFIRECADADAIIVNSMIKIPRNVIDHLNRCRIIATIGIGYGVDIPAATEKGICVVNVPDYCLDEVSDHAMALLLACARKINQLGDAVKKGLWYSYKRTEIRNEIWPGMLKLRGRTLGLIGFGNIAQLMVAKARGFGMDVIAYDPFPKIVAFERLNVPLVDLEELVEQSDFVSLHCPLFDSNYHFFNADLLARMKTSAILINTGRGQLIDENALYDALVSGKIAGAGLDVLEEETPPNPHSPLLRLPQVIVTAHSAHYSDTAIAELKQRPDQAIYELFTGTFPKGLVNQSVVPVYDRKWK